MSALLYLKSLISGIEMGSSIPVQASELKFLYQLIASEKENKI